MFGLGILKGTALGLVGGITIGLAIKEVCKYINNRKSKNSKNHSNDDDQINGLDN